MTNERNHACERAQAHIFVQSGYTQHSFPIRSLTHYANPSAWKKFKICLLTLLTFTLFFSSEMAMLPDDSLSPAFTINALSLGVMAIGLFSVNQFRQRKSSELEQWIRQHPEDALLTKIRHFYESSKFSFVLLGFMFALFAITSMLLSFNLGALGVFYVFISVLTCCFYAKAWMSESKRNSCILSENRLHIKIK